MERVAFIVEDTGERIDCLLNPDTVVVRRHAGLRRRRTAGGIVTGTNLADDPLMATGGGRTELELELLFDVTINPTEPPIENVQDLTRRLWQLAENTAADDSIRGAAAGPLRLGQDLERADAGGVRRPSGSSGSRRPACRSGRGSIFG